MDTSGNRLEGLYQTWWNVIETSLRMLLPPQAPNAPAVAGSDAGAARAAAPEAAKPAVQALEMTQRLLAQYYGSANLGSAEAAQNWHAWATQNTESLKRLMENAAQQSLLPNAIANPAIFEALDRTFAALTDALGMGPSKTLRDAIGEMMAAEERQRQAQLAYFSVLGAAWRKVIEEAGARFGELQARGEPPTSFVELVRMWAGLADRRMHEAMQSDEGLKATAEYMRATARFRLQLNRVVAIASEALNVPTRSEVDDAYLEIQQLKRRVRALERASKAKVRRRGAKPAPRE